MRTLRKPIAGLVMALAAVFGYAALPSTAQAAAYPDIEGTWDSNYGTVELHQPNNNLVWGNVDRPNGVVQVLGHFTGPNRLSLTINGVQKDGYAKLWILPSQTNMRGYIKLDDIRIPFRWTLAKQ